MTNKETAIDFLQRCASGKAKEAFERFTTPDFKHHNAYYPGDAKSLADGMTQHALANADKDFEVQHALEDGSFVAVHSKVTMPTGNKTVAVVHLLRFQDGKIAELWDVGQEVPASSPNENGLF